MTSAAGDDYGEQLRALLQGCAVALSPAAPPGPVGEAAARRALRRVLAVLDAPGAAGSGFATPLTLALYPGCIAGTGGLAAGAFAAMQRWPALFRPCLRVLGRVLRAHCGPADLARMLSLLGPPDVADSGAEADAGADASASASALRASLVQDAALAALEEALRGPRAPSLSPTASAPALACPAFFVFPGWTRDAAACAAAAAAGRTLPPPRCAAASLTRGGAPLARWPRALSREYGLFFIVRVSKFENGSGGGGEGADAASWVPGANIDDEYMGESAGEGAGELAAPVPRRTSLLRAADAGGGGLQVWLREGEVSRRESGGAFVHCTEAHRRGQGSSALALSRACPRNVLASPNQTLAPRRTFTHTCPHPCRSLSVCASRGGQNATTRKATGVRGQGRRLRPRSPRPFPLSLPCPRPRRPTPLAPLPAPQLVACSAAGPQSSRSRRRWRRRPRRARPRRWPRTRRGTPVQLSAWARARAHAAAAAVGQAGIRSRPRRRAPRRH